MKFGVVLPMIGSLAGTDAIDAVCDKAEEAGIDSIWVIDHILLPYSIGAKYPYNVTGEWMAGQGPWWDAFSVLSYAAARTSTVELGSCVIILPYRHPVHTAKIVATIDQLSRGRVQFGIGVGWMKDEFENLQLDSFHHRGALVNEQIEVFKEVWANDPASFDGDYYRFNEVSVTPKPVQRPHPPILVGGNSEAALERTAALCDGWLGISLRPTSSPSIAPASSSAAKPTAATAPTCPSPCSTASSSPTTPTTAPPSPTTSARRASSARSSRSSRSCANSRKPASPT